MKRDQGNLSVQKMKTYRFVTETEIPTSLELIVKIYLTLYIQYLYMHVSVFAFSSKELCVYVFHISCVFVCVSTHKKMIFSIKVFFIFCAVTHTYTQKICDTHTHTHTHTPPLSWMQKMLHACINIVLHKLYIQSQKYFSC